MTEDGGPGFAWGYAVASKGTSEKEKVKREKAETRSQKSKSKQQKADKCRVANDEINPRVKAGAK